MPVSLHGYLRPLVSVLFFSSWSVPSGQSAKKARSGVVLALQRQGQADFCECKASLVYTVSPRPAEAIYSESYLQKEIQNLPHLLSFLVSYA